MSIKHSTTPASQCDHVPGDVPASLLKHHLGVPPHVTLDAELSRLADGARHWYCTHGSPWAYTRHVEIREIARQEIRLAGGVTLTSELLARGFHEADAHAMVILAVSAGEAIDEEIRRLWCDDRPDEAMYLNAYAVATTEHLRARKAAQLAQSMGEQGMSVLPHYSPGYDGWDLGDQAQLYAVISSRNDPGAPPLPGRLEMLDSGSLRPSKSMLAAYGITRRTDLDDRLADYWCCRTVEATRGEHSSSRAYAFPEKALARWSKERLETSVPSGRELLAQFHFAGSTCTNMGLAFALDYRVKLRKDSAGRYHIEACTCEPAPGDTGHEAMCGFQVDPDAFFTRACDNQPYVGQPLDDVLDWQYEASSSGCLCTRANQNHKWRIVLETIHYALERHATATS